MSELNWNKLKDSLVLGVGGLLVALLLYLLQGQNQTNLILAQLRTDLAVLNANHSAQKEKVADLESRVRDLESKPR